MIDIAELVEVFEHQNKVPRSHLSSQREEMNLLVYHKDESMMAYFL